MSDLDTLTPSRARSSEITSEAICFRLPVPEDGIKVWDLIASCPPLDQNSVYCNLLQCTDFAQTCVIAEKDQQIVGWVSGYIPPTTPETFFVWQVAVHEAGRGQRLAQRMIKSLLTRKALEDVSSIKTTITSDNPASWALFRSIAKKLDAPLSDQEWFGEDRHFDGRHKTEHLVTIGPF